MTSSWWVIYQTKARCLKNWPCEFQTDSITKWRSRAKWNFGLKSVKTARARFWIFSWFFPFSAHAKHLRPNQRYQNDREIILHQIRHKLEFLAKLTKNVPKLPMSLRSTLGMIRRFYTWWFMCVEFFIHSGKGFGPSCGSRRFKEMNVVGREKLNGWQGTVSSQTERSITSNLTDFWAQHLACYEQT